MSEEILVRQGAPTLAGIKTGSLFPCPCEDHEAPMTDIRWAESAPDRRKAEKRSAERQNHSREHPRPRDELRGWYHIKRRFVENEVGQRFYFDFYGAKWLAFPNGPGNI